MMVYVPLSRARARELRDAGALEGPLPAHAVTPALLEAHDLSADAEDAEYTALAYAGVSALRDGSDPLRLVVAAEPAPFDDPDSDPDDPFGRVVLPGLSWAAVTALFADDAASTTRIAQGHELAGGRDFAVIVDDQQIEALLDQSDLLWFAREELDQLL